MNCALYNAKSMMINHTLQEKQEQRKEGNLLLRTATPKLHMTKSMQLPVRLHCHLIP